MLCKLPNHWKCCQYESKHSAQICDRTGRTWPHLNGAHKHHCAGWSKTKRESSVHAPAHSVLHPAILRAKACKAGRGMRAGTHPKAVGSAPTGAAEKRLSTRVSRVPRLCPIFRTQPGAYPPETQKPDAAPTCGRTENSTEAQRSGFGRKRKCGGMDETCRLRQMRENAENGQNRGILDAAARKQDKRMASKPTLFLFTSARSADCINGLRRRCD